MTVDVVIPVFNEERVLRESVSVLYSHLVAWSPFEWTITVADNASTDRTPEIARELAAELPHIRLLTLDRKGKGHAIRSAWATSAADVLAYTDADLSTDLGALLPMLAAVANGHSDLAIGSRLAPGARHVRSLRREVASRAYNKLLHLVHGVRFADAQCGFKAARADAVRALLPRIKADSWFFDTELLLLAEHNGLRVHEVPVDWVEDPDSKVRVPRVAFVTFLGTLQTAWAKATGAARIAGLPRRSDLGPEKTHRAQAVAALGVLAVGSALSTLAVYSMLRAWWPVSAAAVGAAFVATRLGAGADWVTSAGPGRFRSLLSSVLLFAGTGGALDLTDGSRTASRIGLLLAVESIHHWKGRAQR